jgi:uncharacterized membrane protein
LRLKGKIKMLGNLVSGEIGLIHLIVSVFALVFGTWVLAARKGTRRHRRIGYAYAVSMILLLGTAFMIYHLFGRFGVFHVAAIVSAATLLGGMIPVIWRRPKNSWLNLHFSFMYWSVFGLYAAFVAETAVRLPIKTAFSSPPTFFITVAVATLVTMLVGQIIFFKNKKKWQAIFTEPTKKGEPSLRLGESA